MTLIRKHCSNVCDISIYQLYWLVKNFNYAKQKREILQIFLHISMIRHSSSLIKFLNESRILPAHFWTAELPSESFIVPLFNFSVTFRTRKAFSFLSFLYITFSQKYHWLLYIAEEAWILTSFAKCRDRRFFCLLSTTKIA